MRSAHRLWLLAITLFSAMHANADQDPLKLSASLAARVQANAAWQAQAKKCPAESMPARATLQPLRADPCQGPGRMESCLAHCETGDANACYWLANGLQPAGGADEGYEPLYQRACSLGLVSGCTNRAAGMLAADADSPEARQCAVQTFAGACDLDDPWACTMYGFHLSRGIGVKADLELALKVLQKSCRFGPQDPACSGAEKLREEILQARRAAES